MGGVFGNRATELTGIIVRSSYQAKRIGSRMLHAYVAANDPTYITAHTRNPALLVMLAHSCGGEQNVYPLNNLTEHSALALQIPAATQAADGTVYHINRYGEAGQYGGQDPADCCYGGIVSLKQRFTELEQPGNALVVVAEPHRRRMTQ
jgi:hypothetical protein